METVSRTSAKQHYAANTTLAVYKHLHRQYANAKLETLNSNRLLATKKKTFYRPKS